jgi:hypothetical protein
VPTTTQIIGPLQGILHPGGVAIELLNPDKPEGPDDPSAGLVPYELVERMVAYTAAPWPLGTQSPALSLHRCEVRGYANEPRHWCAARPTAGRAFVADTDGDGLPDEWEESNRLNPRDASDAPLDGDGDGASNIAEYRAGTDPWDGSSVLQFTRVDRLEAGLVQLEFSAAPERTYQIEQAQALPPADWQPAWEGGPFPDHRTNSVTLPTLNDAPAYYRVGVISGP